MGHHDNSKFLQTSLFSLLDSNQTNCTALYDLAPRYVHRVEKKGNDTFLTVIKREFTFNGEPYLVTVTPARIIDSDGKEHDSLPGEREQLVEDVIRRFTAERMQVNQDQIETPYTIYAIKKELDRHYHTFSRAEIKEALIILNKSNIEITKIVPEGSRKPKPVVSASAFPVLKFADTADGEQFGTVQLNPLLVQAIKSLAFEQINYNWMMSIRGPLPRWIFKYISLLLSNQEEEGTTIRLHASEIALSYGHIRARWRGTLEEVVKAVDRLAQNKVISDYTKQDVFDGKKKQDVILTLKFSDEFVSDRKKARARSAFIQSEANKVSKTTMQPISVEEAMNLRMAHKQVTMRFLESAD